MGGETGGTRGSRAGETEGGREGRPRLPPAPVRVGVLGTDGACAEYEKDANELPSGSDGGNGEPTRLEASEGDSLGAPVRATGEISMSPKSSGCASRTACVLARKSSVKNFVAACTDIAYADVDTYKT